MLRKLISVSLLLLVVALLATLTLSCRSDEPELTPSPPTSEAEAAEDFRIEVIKPDSVTWSLSWVTVWIFCDLNDRYQDLEVNSATIAVSFPEISDVTNVMFYSSTMDSHSKYAPGDEVSTDYGRGGQITAQYPILEGHKGTWIQGTQDGERRETFTFRVRPENEGTFTFYVKVYGSVETESTSVLLYGPSSGTKDQQNEFVQVHSFQVGS
jgi:hypothetical protein